jgi:hypothetical protein
MEDRVPPLDIAVPIAMSCALLWWVSRGMSWSNRLIVIAVTLVVIVVVILAERAGYWPEQLRR